jgi:hypothetical protein
MPIELQGSWRPQNMLFNDIHRAFDTIKDPLVSFVPQIPHDTQGQGPQTWAAL